MSAPFEKDLDVLFEELNKREIPEVDPALGYARTSKLTVGKLRQYFPEIDDLTWKKLVSGKIEDYFTKRAHDQDFGIVLLFDAWYEHQRYVASDWLYTVMESMEDGTYKAKVDPIIIGLLDGYAYHLAGRHRTVATVATGKSYVHNYQIINFDSYEEMREFYGHTHTRRAANTNTKNTFWLDKTTWKMTERFVDKVVSAVKAVVVLNMDPRTGFTKDMLMSDRKFYKDILPTYKKAAEAIYEILENGERDILKGLSYAGRLGFMLVAMRYQPAKASALLMTLANPRHLSEDTPAWFMNRVLKDLNKPIDPVILKAGRGYSTGVGQQIEHASEFSVLWFRYCKQVTMKRYIVPPELVNAPIFIEGAPAQHQQGREHYAVRLSKKDEAKQTLANRMARVLGARKKMMTQAKRLQAAE